MGITAGGLKLAYCAADSNYGDFFVPAAIPCQTRVAKASSVSLTLNLQSAGTDSRLVTMRT